MNILGLGFHEGLWAILGLSRSSEDYLLPMGVGVLLRHRKVLGHDVDELMRLRFQVQG